MSETHPGNPGAGQVYQLPNKLRDQQAKHQAEAEGLLAAYLRGDPAVVAQFRQRHPDADKSGFTPTLLDARLLVTGGTTRVKRLSLEKLKKEAKALLKAFKSGSEKAQQRFAQYHPKSVAEPKLADAQWVIARENGLSSWPKLKAHIDSHHRAEKQLARADTIPDADLKTLHIRCGNDIEEPLKTCGFRGDFLEVNNPFPQGPVPPFEPLEPFIQARTEFIRQNYGEDIPAVHLDETESSLRRVESVLRSVTEQYERVVLWYEHDPFDQLSKAYVLAHLARLDRHRLVVESIQVAQFPGVRKFIGLGQLSRLPETLLMLWEKRRRVSQAEVAFGARCWSGFTETTPHSLWRITREAEVALPSMQRAMQRMLMELPWKGNGLSLTEQLILAVLDREGPMRPAAIFNLLMTELEPLPFLGDIMLLTVLRPLWQGERPAISLLETFEEENPMRRSLLGITDFGRALLKGEENWLHHRENVNRVERHVGGVGIITGAENWYWSTEDEQPVRR